MLRVIAIIKEHLDVVYSLLLLKDKRIASCSEDKTIRIFNPIKNYQCEIIIKGHLNAIYSICQLENSHIVSCSLDNSIRIWSITQYSYRCMFTIFNAHNYSISKVLSLSSERIASSSWDNTIKIWKGTSEYSDIPIRVLRGHTDIVRCIIEIKERNILVSISYDKNLLIWSLLTYQCVSVIRGVDCLSNNNIIRKDIDRLLIGDNDRINIVNINKCFIEDTIVNKEKCDSLCKLTDTLIICGCMNSNLYLLDSNKKELVLVGGLHSNIISDIITIDESTLISSSWDSNIIVWKWEDL